MDWMLAPIDPGRSHEISSAVSWHGRTMVLAWGVLVPLFVVVARFFKVTPGQDWPRELDNKMWWRFHWVGQTCAVALSLLGLFLVLPGTESGPHPHARLGYLVLAAGIVQIVLGVVRGSKGGPTARAADGSLRGHHYDMTAWRVMFEVLHKSIGYGAVVLAVVAILLGLWRANVPVWIWLALCLWWAAVLFGFALLQRRGMAIDTYQAIWGNDPSHPGNLRPAPGWGMRRIATQSTEKGATPPTKIDQNDS